MRIAKAQIVFEGFVTPPGLVVSRLELSGAGVEPHHDRVDLDGPAIFAATVEEAALAEFLDKERPGGLSNFAVKIQPGGISIRATKRVIIAIPLSVECVIDVEERRKLNIRLLEASAFGAGVTTLAENEIAKANPIFDAAEIPVTLEFDRVELRDGALIVHGEIHGPIDPKAF